MIKTGCRLCFISTERRKRLRLEESEVRRRTWNERFTDRNTGIQDPDDLSRRRTGCSELTSPNFAFRDNDDDNFICLTVYVLHLLPVVFQNVFVFICLRK